MTNLNDLKNLFTNFIDKKFRFAQVEALDYLFDSSRDCKILCAPTGSGKSLIATCIGAHHKQFIYLCSSKMLQDQIECEFPEVAVMKGRSNYPCRAFKGKDASVCPYLYNKEQKQECISDPGCPYEERKKYVLAQPYICLNYSYFLTECNYVGMFSGYPIVICDEADSLENILTNFINITIPWKLVDSLGIDPPAVKLATSKGAVNSWKGWAKGCMGKIDNRLDVVNEGIGG